MSVVCVRHGRIVERTNRYSGYDLANATIHIEQHPEVVGLVEGFLEEFLRIEQRVFRGHVREPGRRVREDNRVSYASVAQ